MDCSSRKRSRGSARNITEEEIAEYIAKKAQKKAIRVANKLKGQTTFVSGYSNDSNPFGDSNLNQSFVWRKKIELDLSQKRISLEDFSVKAEKKRQRKRMEEFEKVKKRREERAIEKAQREEDMAFLARERARAEFQDWEKKEEEFDFDQSKVRSEIRLREGRPKPIDVLSKHLSRHDLVFKGLTVEEMEELRDDIKTHLSMAETPADKQYWEALTVVCNWKLAEARRLEQPEQERGLHSSVEADVNNLLEGKTHGELEAMQSNIESEMRTGAAKVVEYWEAVLKRLHIFKAKACLKEIDAKFLPSESIEDHNLLKEPRKEQEEEYNLELKAMKGMGEIDEGDEEFGSSDEVNMNSDDEYRLIKPKYFNRVHTGYEWNKYNRTHYDDDNPPPKFVQGYKFNIFYPKLMNSGQTPEYTVMEEEDGKTCIIRFHAGPPYEDIAFRIVNKEWERSRKKGFKQTFDGGILRLYFNFKRYRYRR